MTYIMYENKNKLQNINGKNVSQKDSDYFFTGVYKDK